MKKLFITSLVVLFLPVVSYCQQLSLDQLLSLSNKKVNVVSDFLQPNSWVFDHSAKAKDNNTVTTVWKNNSSSLKVLFEEYGIGNNKSITYSSSKENIEAIKDRAEAMGLKQVRTGSLQDGTNYTTIAGKTVSLRFLTPSPKLKEGQYSVLISGIGSKR